MKRLFTALALLLTFTLSISAMSYSQARDQALFLTDKMAYELNLTDEQYEAAYEINLDYLMRIDDYDDLYGVYWRQRNLDLSYILLDWQYRAYCDASYFYRPLYWSDGFWHFGIYARYPHRDYFFFGCPNFVFTYTGGHSWYHNGGRSWYYGRVWHGPRDGGRYLGMRHGWDNGRYGGGYVYHSGRRTWAQASPQYNNRSNNNRSFGNRTFGNLQRGGVNDSPLRTGNRSFGSQPQSQARPRSFGMSTDSNRSFGMPRESSTRSTVNRSSDRSFGSGVFGNHATTSSSPRSTFTPQQSAPARSYSAPTRSSSQSSPFGGHSTGSFGSRSTSGGGSFGGGRSSGGGFGRR